MLMVASTIHSFATASAFKSWTLNTVFSAVPAIEEMTDVTLSDTDVLLDAEEISSPKSRPLLDSAIKFNWHEQIVAIVVTFTSSHRDCFSNVPLESRLAQRAVEW